MTKKKKSIISDQRFIVLLVIIALSAVFSIMSKEFRRVLFRSLIIEKIADSAMITSKTINL